MADGVNVERTNVYNNSAHPHEKITPVTSINNSGASKDAEGEEKDMKYGEHVQEKEISLETLHSSMQDDSEEVASRERRVFEKYKIFIHLFIWLVMTG